MHEIGGEFLRQWPLTNQHCCQANSGSSSATPISGDIRVTREQQSGLCWAVLVAVSLVPMSVSPCNCLHSFIPVYSRPCPPSRLLPKRLSLLSSKPRYSSRWSPSLPRTRPLWRGKRTARSRCPSPTRSRSGGRRLLAVVCIPLSSRTFYIFVNCAFYFTYTIV